MKQYLIYLAVIFFTINFAYSQEEIETKYSIGLKVYTPIYLTGTDKFYNDNWILWARQNRTYTKYAFGLDFKYYFTENISLKLWGGISNRSLTESSYEEFSDSFSGQNVTTQISENLEYEQTSYNISGGINFSEKINQFEINTGLELSYLHTGKGRETYHGWFRQYSGTNSPDSNDINGNMNISSGNSFGLGIFIGAEYNIFKHFSIGVEFHQFMFYSVFNNNSSVEYTQYTRYSGTPNFIMNKNESKENFKQFGFSDIVPVFEIMYKF